MSDEIAVESDHSDRTAFERLISLLERFGLNVARLLLAVTITVCVVMFVLNTFALIVDGVRYSRATSKDKYVISSLEFTPKFSNVRLGGKSQNEAAGPIKIDRVGAFGKSRDQLVSERLAYTSQVGVCYGGQERCHDLGYQRKFHLDNWNANNVHAVMRDGSAVSYGQDLEFAELSPYYGAFGFGAEIEAQKAEWEATNVCLSSYKERNGNLYIQKAPELFDAIVAQCDHDYSEALAAELKSRPENWTLGDTGRVMILTWTLIGVGLTIIAIALTILLFRLEVSFRSLRNLNRLHI